MHYIFRNMRALAAACIALTVIIAPASFAATAAAQATESTQAAAPVINPEGGNNLVQPVTVTLSTTTSGAVIRYTTDGTAPTVSSPAYGGPFSVGKTTTVKAIAVKSGLTTSPEVQAVFTFSSSANTDTVAPIITDVTAQPGSKTALVTWKTNEPADSQVEYGVGTLTNASDVENILGTSHSMVLKNLDPDKPYVFRVASMDSNGNLAVSSSFNFRTLTATGGTTPPPPPPPSTTPPPPPTQGSGGGNGTVVLPPNVDDGDIVKFDSSPTVYLVAPEGLHPFDTLASLNEYQQVSGEQVTQLKGKPSTYTVDPTYAKVVLNQQSDSNANSPQYLTGTLADENGTVYFLENKDRVKIPFTKWDAFVGLGFKAQNILKGDFSSFRVANSYWIESPTQAHPWGSWVLYTNGKERTIYYVAEQGLIGVPSWEVFLNNGGRDHLILPINAADNAVWNANKNLPVLQMNDERTL